MPSRRHWLPFLILFAGVVASLAAAGLLASVDRERSEARFNALATSAATAVSDKMQMQFALLRGIAGLFNASGIVSADEFRLYVDRLQLQRNHPGVLGIGYAAFATDRAGIAADIAATGAGGPRTAMWPDGDRDSYSAILFLEPMNRLNQAAIGFDMMSEPTRRAAMIRAMRTGRTSVSGKVRLVQEIEERKQPGFLIYTPLREGAGEGFRGWVYSPLRGFDLFGSLFGGREFDAVDIAVFDGAPRPENLLYGEGEAARDAKHQTVLPLEFGGRAMTVRVSTSDRFSTSSPLPLSLVVAISGILISLLLAYVVRQRERAMAGVEQLVDERTAALIEVNRKLRGEMDARSAAEAKLHQMQRMESIGQLTGGIAHDFNNMLSVVIGNLDLAQRNAEDRKKVDRLIGQALKGAGSAAELTQRLLAFSRRQTLVPSVVDANALISDMQEMVSRAIGETIVLETRLADDLWPILADAAQLESAILNLAVNARDAMPGGGTLTIITENALQDGDGTLDEHAREFVRIVVDDSGAGMSPEVIARAAEPFFTTKRMGQGTGLGLSQVYGFAEQSGGFLDIQSKEGEGTRVTIGLPRHRGETAASARTRTAVSEPAAQARGSILVVEDEEDVRAFSAEALSGLGYSVLQAADGAAALEMLEKHDVDLVFTDMVMPGMSGSQLADAARSRKPDLRVLFTTGYTDEELFRDGRGSRGAAILHKPFTVDQLAEKVAAILDSQARKISV